MSCYPVSPLSCESGLLSIRQMWFRLFGGKNDEIEKFCCLYEEEIIKDNHGKPIRVKNPWTETLRGQRCCHDIVFGIGPAGTGKTFLAVTLAVTALKRDRPSGLS